MKKLQRAVALLSASATLFSLGLLAQTASAEELSAPPTLAQSPHQSTRKLAQLSKQDAPFDGDPPSDPDAGPVAKSPLNFESFGEDPINFNLPKVASQFKNEGENTWTIGRPTPGGSGAGQIPDNLKEFYTQQIKWQECKPFGIHSISWGSSPDHTNMVCGYVIAPLDYTKPHGPTIALGLLKLPAKDKAHRLGTLFANPGGPGASGMKFVADGIKDYSTNTKLLDRFDVIGFDPRGVGKSLPQIRCESSAAFDAQREGSDGLKGSELDKIQEFNAKECYKNTAQGFIGLNGNMVIPQMGTTNVARDLDMMRSVVGDKKLNYLGLSYGTEIGYTYAKLFKNNIRSMVLDGAENPLRNNPTLLNSDDFSPYLPSGKGESRYLAQLRGVEESFRKFIVACLTYKVDNADCALADINNPVAGSPTEEQINAAYAKYLKIARAAWKTGYYHDDDDPDRPVSFHDVTWGTRFALYNTDYWHNLNAALNNMLNNRDASFMMQMSDSYFNRNYRGQYDFSDAAFHTISCIDSATTDRVSTGELEEGYKISPLMDPGSNKDGSPRGREATHDDCYYYKTHEQMTKGEVVYDAPNILVISSSHDPATPFENGVILAKTLQGTLLAVANDSHCAYGKVDCATNLSEQYFEDPAAFTQKVKSGAFASSDDSAVTGETGVETKNIYSKLINGNECQVVSFMGTLKKPVEKPKPTPTEPKNPANPLKPQPAPVPSVNPSPTPHEKPLPVPQVPGMSKSNPSADNKSNNKNPADKLDKKNLASTGSSSLYLVTITLMLIVTAGLTGLLKKCRA